MEAPKIAKEKLAERWQAVASELVREKGAAWLVRDVALLIGSALSMAKEREGFEPSFFGLMGEFTQGLERDALLHARERKAGAMTEGKGVGA